MVVVQEERRPRRARDARRAGRGGGGERRQASAPHGLGRERDARAAPERGQQRVVSPHPVDTSRCAKSAERRALPLTWLRTRITLRALLAHAYARANSLLHEKKAKKRSSCFLDFS
jgi:hypothetical protein